ncbi:MAG: DUF4623 domain-containing protein [Planctomycetes bacterium]|nr:DUF4623 domain-containing protein [Planctomycetota bacterium]
MACPRTSLACAIAALLGAHSPAQSTMTPLATFGTNGWLAPASIPHLGIANNERGLAYNPQTGNLVLVSRTGGTNLRVLNGTTGVDLGALNATGITGGTFAVNMADIAADGSIYVCNLSTSLTANFKVYKWDSEALGMTNAPTVAYDALTTVPRTGDAFAVTGGVGANPVLFAASGSNSATPALNGYFVVGAADGTNAATAYTAVAGTAAPNNGYRLGMTFVDQNTIIGTQGASALVTAFNGSTATLTGSIPTALAQRALDYAVIGGTPILAIIDSNSSVVSIYDITVPGTPTLLASATTTSGALTGNTNGAGAVQWGAITGNSATLYAMNTNQGIQAFSVTIQLPASARSFGVGCGAPALALAASAAPVLGTTINLDLTDIPATTAFAIYALGFVGIPGGVPLPIAPGCNQYLVPFTTELQVTGGATSAQLPLILPNVGYLVGVEVFGQGVTLDGVSSAILTSNGLRLYLETF